MKAEPRYWPAISESFWEGVRTEYGLWTMDECEQHFRGMFGDPELYMRQLVRVFVGDETLAPAYQFDNGQPDPRVLALFERAMKLKVPHNSFTVWMLSPLPGTNSPRPVDVLRHPDRLLEYLEEFARNRP